MRRSISRCVLLLLFSGALISVGCGDDSTEPNDNKQPPSEELEHSWSALFGDEEEQVGISAAIDPSGNTIVAGSFWGTVDFGGGALTSAGAQDIFVAKFDPDGLHLWSKKFGDGTGQEYAFVAVDGSGNVIIAGSFYGSLDFGGGVLTSAGSNDIFAAKFGPDGTHLWSKRFGNSSPQLGCWVATDPSGNVLLAGRFAGSIDFGGGALSSAGNEDVFLAKLDPDGGYLWSYRFGDASAQYATAVAADASGNVAVAGHLEGSVDFGGGVLTNAGSIDIFLARFDADGAHLWSKRFGDSEADWLAGLASDAAGNIVLAGAFEGGVNFGGGTLASAGQSDGFVAKFDSDGDYMWSKRFGDVSEQSANSVAIDAAGDVIMGGTFYGTVNLGGGDLTSAGSWDILIARFSSSGSHLWSGRFGDDSDQYVRGIAAGSAGVAAVTGGVDGAVDFGGGLRTSANSLDIFVVKFAP